MKVTFRLPSKKIGYGYAEIEFELDEATTLEAPANLGAMYAKYTLDFQTGEIDAVVKYQEDMKKGEALLKSELGAKVVSEEAVPDQPEPPQGDAPWEQPAPAASPKPWETKSKVSLF